jgi:hypothetical protein
MTMVTHQHRTPASPDFLQVTYKSEEVLPEDLAEPVKVVRGNSFKDIVSHEIGTENFKQHGCASWQPFLSAWYREAASIST